MHVLQVIDDVSRLGAAGRSLLAMTPRLVRAGVSLDVAYLHDAPGGCQAELTGAGAAVFAVGRPGRTATAAALHRLIRERRPDLVHTTRHAGDRRSDLLARAAALAARTPVVTSLADPPPGAAGAAGRGPSQALDAATARGTRRFHALTRYVAATTAQHLRVPRRRIDVVPRGRDPELLGTATPERRATVREALGLPGDVPVVLAAAGQYHHKGLDVLLHAWPAIRRAEPAAVLLLAGADGPETALLRALADATDAGDVRFLGARADVADLMAAADAVAVPARRDGQGGAAIEAMGVGTPLVCTDLPGLRETVGSEDYARLVPPERPADLAAAIADTLAHRSAARSRATAARARFLTSFTLHQVSSQMVEFYERSLRVRPA
ncbi:glycosyltransferase family 4 protein [Streptomyces sp. SP17BM10]|uniref:glycosyltransferase family 4 protein n=1 Tax=Streptomyces sp. SP17BM10 TaxID=3002530 RepID=UPI002E75CACD|nr:glycosyltransferase family 4 protein [Streptomyces sp. SP17BM10]MEE1783579.1 glycosyltransferase family 4 protein [Streptomyces sp. SP17BM10]